MTVSRSVSFHPAASQEVKGAIAWYRERDEATARAFVLEIDIAAERIAASPTRWPLLVGDLHRYLLKRFPFSVIYRVRHDEVQIIAIAHSRRQPGYWAVR